MCHYGIIGYPLGHSFSARYFNEKFIREGIDAEYSLYPIEELTEERMDTLMSSLDGFNVTYPYKETVIPYLCGMDKNAKAIGAVNVVYQGIGYNTDFVGFMQSIQSILRAGDNKALVLGTGGASKAVCYGLTLLGISPTRVSRSGAHEAITYEQLDEQTMQAHSIIVNCTPLGMIPDVESCPPIPYDLIDSRHLLFDCVYNPEQTVFLTKGKAQGATIKNGMEMLIGQAKAAWEIWGKNKSLKYLS